jgi:tetratricopeptide (TPR) repeat protein
MKPFVAGLAIVLALMTASYLRNEIWQNDLTLWSDVLEHAPGKVRSLNEMGLYLVDRRQYEQALEIFQRSIAMNRYQSTIYINMGLAYEGLGRYDEAVKVYQLATQIQSTDPTGYYNLGALYYNVFHDRKTAQPYFERARDLNPNEPDVHLFLSKVYADNGDVVRSQSEYSRYLMLK